ncbi:MAG TPA: nucleotidyltransferase domain-containing protein [Methylomusa anaerophila]|nr:nucleotidyltransferase domain-containing protein [Methylomusa anaerophila]HML88596.1 nucleotidyltransferase domain-containing protein [Methylomusa anaerophila]
MMADHAAVLDRVKELVLAGLGSLDARVYLFGSWARGEQRRGSDIDIAVEYKNGVPPAIMVKIRELLEESAAIPYRVDVVDLVKAGCDFAGRVKREGIIWRDYTKG